MFSICLRNNFVKPYKILSHSAHSDNFFFFFFLLVVQLSWYFVRSHEIFFQTGAQNFSFLSWKTKKVLILKINWAKPRVTRLQYQNNQLCLLTKFSATVLVRTMIFSTVLRSEYKNTWSSLDFITFISLHTTYSWNIKR